MQRDFETKIKRDPKLETEAFNQTGFLNLFKLLNSIQMSAVIKWTIEIELEAIRATLFDNLHKTGTSLTLYLALILCDL